MLKEGEEDERGGGGGGRKKKQKIGKYKVPSWEEEGDR